MLPVLVYNAIVALSVVEDAVADPGAAAVTLWYMDQYLVIASGR